MTALKRSSKSPRKRVPASSAPVSSEKTSAPFEQIRHVVLQQPRREPFGERGLADAGVADEHRVVLAPAAEDLHRALQLVGAADQRIELAGRARAPSGSSRRRPADRATVRRRARLARLPRPDAPAVVGRSGAGGGTLLMPCVMYSRTSSRVTPCAASSCAAYDLVCCSVAASTSPDCTSWRPALWTCSTAVCSTRRNASVCSGSFCWPRANCSTDSLQVPVEIVAQLRQVGAAGGEDPLAVRVVRQRVEQVLERQVRVPPRASPRGRRPSARFRELD